MRTLHLIYWKNGKGLELDAGILAGIAESAGYEVSFSETRNPGHYGELFSDHVATRWHNWKLRRKLLRPARRSLSTANRPPYDVAICLEVLSPPQPLKSQGKPCSSRIRNGLKSPVSGKFLILMLSFANRT